MYHAERIAFNRLSGRKIWLLRELVGDQYGDAWLSSLVVIKNHYFCKNAYLMLADGVRSTRQYRQLKTVLKTLGFSTAYAVRHGRRKIYKVI